MKQSLVIVPTYNEAENVNQLIQSVLSLQTGYHLLIVDDDSPDGTAQFVAKKITKWKNRLHLLSRKRKLGLGTAYIEGFKWALKRQYDYIFEMDADFSHNPKHLERLLAKAKEGFDVVIGSRYIKQGRILNWTPFRRFLSTGGSYYARIITGLRIKDPTAGFICYKQKVLERIDFSKITSVGYAFQIEMKFAAKSLGFKLAEVPITFMDRQLGESKMHSDIIKEAALAVLKMRIKKLKGTTYYRS